MKNKFSKIYNRSINKKNKSINVILNAGYPKSGNTLLGQVINIAGKKILKDWEEPIFDFYKISKNKNFEFSEILTFLKILGISKLMKDINFGQIWSLSTIPKRFLI